MNQEIKQSKQQETSEISKINPNEYFHQITEQYFAGIREYLTGMESILEETYSTVDLNAPLRARVMNSFVYNITAQIDMELRARGRNYEGQVSTLRQSIMVINHEYDTFDGLPPSNV